MFRRSKIHDRITEAFIGPHARQKSWIYRSLFHKDKKIQTDVFGYWTLYPKPGLSQELVCKRNKREKNIKKKMMGVRKKRNIRSLPTPATTYLTQKKFQRLFFTYMCTHIFVDHSLFYGKLCQLKFPLQKRYTTKTRTPIMYTKEGEKKKKNMVCSHFREARVVTLFQQEKIRYNKC